METYIFKNQYSTILYRGSHSTDDQAWIAFWDECNFPEYARSINECTKNGIFFEKEQPK